MRILVTGAAGYIGSHACLELLQAGYEVVALDNLSNSVEESLARVQRIAGRSLQFHRLDMLDRPGLEALFARQAPDAVIHFAGLKAVGESVEQPMRYFRNNVEGSMNLLECMGRSGCRSLVFSSSCTVYGESEKVPTDESAPLAAVNPYGRSKLMVEDICRDLARSEKGWRIALLRYFNPIGAHPSGEIGEDPLGVPNGLLPYLLQVAVGRRPFLRVFGNDYPTVDGTGVRDFIHIVDLALGHIKALERLARIEGCLAINLGTGRGHSVLEVVSALSRACGKELPFQILPRRPGDIAQSYADPALAWRELGWKAQRDLQRMCEDAWRWQSRNPQGYRAVAQVHGHA